MCTLEARRNMRTVLTSTQWPRLDRQIELRLHDLQYFLLRSIYFLEKKCKKKGFITWGRAYTYSINKWGKERCSVQTANSYCTLYEVFARMCLSSKLCISVRKTSTGLAFKPDSFTTLELSVGLPEGGFTWCIAVRMNVLAMGYAGGNIVLQKIKVVVKLPAERERGENRATSVSELYLTTGCTWLAAIM